MCSLIFDLHCPLYSNIEAKRNHDIAKNYSQNWKLKMSERFIWCCKGQLLSSKSQELQLST